MCQDSSIYLLDLGLGNISSIVRMIEKVGGRSEVVRRVPNLGRKNKFILPGVGHFDHGMNAMRNLEINGDFFSEVLAREGTILGICLGMQLLCRNSEEGSEPGLGLIDAEVKRFQFQSSLKLKVPHMGWNVVRPALANPLISYTEEEQRFYFVHSYKVVPDDPSVVIGTASYGGDFCAAFQKGNIFGVQFHPEKSHRFGMALMKRFVEL